MQTYKVTAPMGVAIHEGLVTLTPDQYRRRRHAVTPVEKLAEKWEKAVFRLNDKASVMFKSGEEFGYSGEISKAMAGQLADPAEAKKQEEAAAKKEEAKASAATKGGASSARSKTP